MAARAATTTKPTECESPTYANSASYWANGFDWRNVERAINAYEHYQVDVDGVRVHFMRRPGVGPKPLPLILSHGWPWTFWHWAPVIDLLADPGAHGGDPADAFDVIVPSLPGFGFTPLPAVRSDMNFWKIADIWHELMTDVLGYTRYVPPAATSVRLSPASSGTSTPTSSTPSTSGQHKSSPSSTAISPECCW